MATITASATTTHRFLRRVLRWDAIYSAVLGLVCLVAAGPLSDFMGINAPMVLEGLGVAILAGSGFLFWISTRPGLGKGDGLLAGGFNVACVIAGDVLLFSGLVPFTLGGVLAIAIVAVDVAILAGIEFYAALRG